MGVGGGHEGDVGLHNVVAAEHHVVGGYEDLAGVMLVRVVGEEACQAEGDPLVPGNR